MSAKETEHYRQSSGERFRAEATARDGRKRPPLPRRYRHGYHPADMKPIRDGAMYCAPFCGAGCTWDEHQAALRAGERLAARLNRGGDGGWTAHVWENMGWHSEAISSSGHWKVKQSGARDFVAFLGEPDSPGGRWAAHGTTPRGAIRAIMRIATGNLEAIRELIEAPT